MTDAKNRFPTAFGGALAAAVAVAATYIYFLLWAQFGFLHALQERAGSDGVRLAMASMGVAGLLASLATGWLHPRLPRRTWIGLGFAACAAAALAALPAREPAALAIAAAAIGVSTALLTVALAAGLPALVEHRLLGRAIGLGTGVAYFVCNLPPLFGGSVTTQALAVAAACAIGLAVTWWTRRRTPGFAERAEESRKTALLGVAAAVTSFLALVWLDSAAFAIIQENLALKAHTWEGPARQLMLGTCHLAAAVVAGVALDRGRFRSLLLTAYALFVVAFTVLQHHPALAGTTGPIYAVGISLYSVALVDWAARHGGRIPRRWRAALVFGIAGWLGSALGVGMAQDLHRIPTLFLWAAGGVLLAGTWLEGRLEGRPVSLAFLRKWVGGQRTTLAATVLAAALYGGGWLTPHPGAFTAHTDSPQIDFPAASAAAQRGQQVYIREGCIHCHSQYVRPGTRDELIYGAATPLDRDAGPVMIGTRRQGPDLSHVGDRRSTAWLERHLRDPRVESPGSRMPSYRHLFSDDPSARSDGRDLLAYLQSLGDGGPRVPELRAHNAPPPGGPGPAPTARAVDEDG